MDIWRFFSGRTAGDDLGSNLSEIKLSFCYNVAMKESKSKWLLPQIMMTTRGPIKIFVIFFSILPQFIVEQPVFNFLCRYVFHQHGLTVKIGSLSLDSRQVIQTNLN